MDEKRARVLLADDHTLVAEGLRRLLEEEFDLVEVVTDGERLVEAVGREHPDVVVADIGMPVLDGIGALRRISVLAPGIPVLMLTMHADPRLAAEALRAGASGYLLKYCAGEELSRAVRTVLAGRTYVTPLIAHDLLASLMEPPEPEPPVRLTRRQREVLRLVAEGSTMKQVAAALQVSRRTAEYHKYQVMQVLGARSTAELVQHAIRLGLVPLPRPSTGFE